MKTATIETGTRITMSGHSIILLSVLFLALSLTDALLTNRIYSLIPDPQLESNPLVRPFLGHWYLGLKGIPILALFLLYARVRHLSSRGLTFCLIAGSVVMAGVCVWNYYQLTDLQQMLLITP